MNLKDKTTIITGGAQGIGAAMATRFTKEGAKVVVADLDEGAALATAAEINGLGVTCDVTKEAEVQALVKSGSINQQQHMKTH